MDELIGKTVVGLRISDNETILAFDHPDGSSTCYQVQEECCSESWFADIVGVNALIDMIVRSASEIDLKNYNVNDGRCRQEEDTAYGYKLTTDRGYVDIIFRNSSNGYYGGWLKLYKGTLPDIMKAITNDWQALNS